MKFKNIDSYPKIGRKFDNKSKRIEIFMRIKQRDLRNKQYKVSNENIDQMLMERHLNKKARRSSHKNHMKGCTMSSGHRFCTDRSGNGDTRKRTEEDDVRFAQSFEKLILVAKSKEGAQSGTI